MFITLFFFIFVLLLIIKYNKMKFTKQMSLISQIWFYLKKTHNEQDYKDLFNFSTQELEEILSDIEFDKKHY